VSIYVRDESLCSSGETKEGAVINVYPFHLDIMDGTKLWRWSWPVFDTPGETPSIPRDYKAGCHWGDTLQVPGYSSGPPTGDDEQGISGEYTHVTVFALPSRSDGMIFSFPPIRSAIVS
jgi:hypothetical protein